MRKFFTDLIMWRQGHQTKNTPLAWILIISCFIVSASTVISTVFDIGTWQEAYEIKNIVGAPFIVAEVRSENGQSFSKAITARTGDRLYFRIQLTNKSDMLMENALIRTILPSGLTYIQNSTRVYTADNINGVSVSDDIISGTGINIGDYASGTSIWIFFSATVNDIAGENSIQRSVAQSNGGFGTVEDYADIAITIE